MWKKKTRMEFDGAVKYQDKNFSQHKNSPFQTMLLLFLFSNTQM